MTTENTIEETNENTVETKNEISFDANGYPSIPIWDDAIKYKKGVIPALRHFKCNYPYSVGYEKRIEGMRELVEKLNALYEMTVNIEFSKTDAEGNDCMETSVKSNYNDLDNIITIIGKPSIITLLHEYAHAKGHDEPKAVLWSLSLFKRVYPIAFTKLLANAHTLVQPTTEAQAELAEVANG